HFAEYRFQGKCRGCEQGRSTQDASKRLGELAIRNRVWRGEVDRADKRVAVKTMHAERDPILAMNPAHVLPAGAHSTSHPDRNGTRCRRRALPSGRTTIPGRRLTVRIPAGEAGPAAPSQATQTRAKKSSPGGLSSISSSPPRGP